MCDCILIIPSCMVAQEDLLDVLYWLRQVIAILAGVAWGLVPLTGLYAFLGCGLDISSFACIQRNLETCYHGLL